MKEIANYLRAAIKQLTGAGKDGETVALLKQALALLPTHIAVYHHGNGDDLYLLRAIDDKSVTDRAIVRALQLDYDETSEWIIIEPASLVIQLPPSGR